MNRKRRLLVAGVLLVSFNFRPAITSIPPVLEAIRMDLSMSYAVISLLTTIPTLLIGIFAFVASPMSQQLGRERTIMGAIILIGVGIALRFWGLDVRVLFATTVIVGVGIALCQGLLPAIIKEHFPNRAAIMTGLYTTSLGVGAAIAAGVTVPLADFFQSWTLALAVWAIPAFLAAVAWVPVSVTRVPGGSWTNLSESDKGTTDGLPWRNRGAWILTLFFSGQTLFYYSELTWIAPYYVDMGASNARAGFVLTVFVVAQIVGSLVISVFAELQSDRRHWIALTILLNMFGLTGIVWFPFVLPIVWNILAGVGMGGMFSLGLTLPVDHTETAAAADRLSSMMIGMSYIIGAVGPFFIGWTRDAFRSYTPAFVTLLGLNIVMLGVVFWFRPNYRIL